VTHLTFGNKFNKPLNINLIPNSVTHLTFGSSFNQPLILNFIPNSVTHLTFGYDFNQPLIDHILSSIKHLTLYENYNYLKEINMKKLTLLKKANSYF
jgi:hypothetical protein